MLPFAIFENLLRTAEFAHATDDVGLTLLRPIAWALAHPRPRRWNSSLGKGGGEGLLQSFSQSAVISPLCPSGASAARRASSRGGKACVKA